ncbi:TetR/AcrR family transcriptional regulator [Streptomyces hyaluromycini]|uniref:TetR/AcrR family transcriptional regulator n=1 Tax=Streptomyces hyaluromycini TaxID=1377993 RepID=A0ABV1X4K5_9ACTN
MPSTRSPRRRPDDARRTELLNAARTVIARDGVTAASTRRITEEAGLPHGMFHYWFSTKEELFEELIGEVVAELRNASASVTSKMDGDSDAGLVDRLRAAFEVVRHDEQRQPGRQIAMYELTTLALRTPALRDMARHQYAAYREATREATAPWLADNDVDLPGGSQALCELLAIVLDGAVLAWLADPEGSNPEQVFTVLDALLARAVPALRAEPTG